MASSWVRARARERIEAIAQRPLDSRVLRRAILDVLAEVVDFDGYVWLLTDPVTTVGAAPLADVPGLHLAELPALIRAKYATHVNRWTSLMLRTPPVALLGTTLEAEPTRGTEWRELVSTLGMGDVASTVFADPFGCWGFLDLWRHRDGGPFESPDAEFIAELASTVTTALRECQARTFVEPARPRRDDVGPVVLTLDDHLEILSSTAASQEWLDVLLPRGPGEHAVPASVYNVGAQLLAVERGIDEHAASARAHLGDGFWVTLRAARMSPVEPPGYEPERADAGIVVTIEETSAVERLDLCARAFALTPREGQLMRLLAAGEDTRAMARDMAVSQHTVQDHLKSIFTKTGARDRVTLLSRALGTRATTDR